MQTKKIGVTRQDKKERRAREKATQKTTKFERACQKVANEVFNEQWSNFMTINDKLHDTIKSSAPIQPKGYVTSYCGIILSWCKYNLVIAIKRQKMKQQAKQT